MHQVDYELGLNSSEEEWNDATGAAALRASCRLGCNGKHPFNRGRRDACKAACDQRYEVRMETGKTWGVRKEISGREAQAAAAAEEAAAAAAAAEEAAQIQAKSGLVQGGASGGAKKAGLGTGAMIGIGAGVLAILVMGVLLIRKNKKS